MLKTALGPRVLLRRLREVMAEPGTAQVRLDRIVKMIASNMVAEVCSVYVLRPDKVLELYATEGLKSEAVHKSQLKVGEGLVGLIGEQAIGLNLTEAVDHPSFKYLPETGEELFHSFLGVPIMRGGSVIGVLVVQNKTRRHYTEEEEEALQTTAMVLAEVLAGIGILGAAPDLVSEGPEKGTAVLKSDSLAEGVALGHAVLHEPRVRIQNMIAESIPLELARIDEAIASLRSEVDKLLAGHEALDAGDSNDILETVRMFAHDKGWLGRLKETVRTGLTAEAAVERVQNDNRARMSRTPDPYLRERMHDLDDLSNRLLRGLTGTVATASRTDLPANTIIVARNMGPAELLDYDRSKIRGVILEEGGKTSHVAIVARALGIPAVGQAEGVVNLVDEGNAIIVDGGTGEIFIRPSSELEKSYAEKVRFQASKQARFKALREMPSITKDGQQVTLNINAGLVVDMPHLHESGAAGVGLYRTELHFMMANRFPRLSSQIKHYKSILDQAGGKPVVFRTLDIGADKTLHYLRQPREENPALGWRSIRMALERPALFNLQVRAMMLAAAGDDLKIMFPMIADVQEYEVARDLVFKERNWLKARGHPLPKSLKLGAMIEIPSLLWQLDNLLPMVDFASVGSNDLVQFLFAADRGNPKLAGRYDPLSPAALGAMRMIVEKGKKHGKTVTLCGELGGRPLEAMGLIGVGLTSMSMVPSGIGPVKAMIRSVDQAKLWDFMQPLLESGKHSIRADLANFAKDNGVEI
ncbi:phosphoenolpyruvate--protein phosphotransferase [Aestuariivirga litoralis]|uniref:phosphoenolpyruvate--protein phosphotransferase n=1 Tax=Aestuariivirga litoralis TaxID=2650924 RepID=UPI0018C85891|nr:phosphoenolpyruvate--protein phosphotransferase [Aestuariivirga litoralis]MBG1233543.1 phosphoenolpyruvate--protein phosphotransferase [Aestuariivirga litoralis]